MAALWAMLTLVCHLELNLNNQTKMICTCTHQLVAPGNRALMKDRAKAEHKERERDRHRVELV